MPDNSKPETPNPKPRSDVTGTAYRIPKPGQVDPRVQAVRAFGRRIVLFAGIAAIVVLCVIFPKFLTFVELASREIRYLWWLIAILALGFWLAFSFGKKKD